MIRIIDKQQNTTSKSEKKSSISPSKTSQSPVAKNKQASCTTESNEIMQLSTAFQSTPKTDWRNNSERAEMFKPQNNDKSAATTKPLQHSPFSRNLGKITIANRANPWGAFV